MKTLYMEPRLRRFMPGRRRSGFFCNIFLIWLAYVLIHRKESRFVFMYSIFILQRIIIKDVQLDHLVCMCLAK